MIRKQYTNALFMVERSTFAVEEKKKKKKGGNTHCNTRECSKHGSKPQVRDQKRLPKQNKKKKS